MAFEGDPGAAAMGEAMLQLQMRALLTVFCGRMETMLPLFLFPRSDLAGGQVVSQLHIWDGQRW